MNPISSIYPSLENVLKAEPPAHLVVNEDELGVVIHAYNLSTWESKAPGS
jgi:hypothetical protein